jgi:glutathionylspermidine synthase
MTDRDYRAPQQYSAAVYRVRLSRKRQIIDAALDELHAMQLDMIDTAVECSDLQQAKELIDHIRSL